MFREERHKINLSFSGDVVRYNQTRTFHFVEEMSLSLETEVYHINVPLLVSSHLLVGRMIPFLSADLMSISRQR